MSNLTETKEDEWVAICPRFKPFNYYKILYELFDENTKLKELLKECQYILKEQNFYRNTPIETDTTYRTRCLKKQELLTKIDEVLK